MSLSWGVLVARPSAALSAMGHRHVVNVSPHGARVTVRARQGALQLLVLQQLLATSTSSTSIHQVGCGWNDRQTLRLKTSDDDACFGQLPPELLGPPVPPPPMTDWTRTASVLQPWGATQFELVRNATRLAPLLASAYGFSAIILLPAPAHLSYCAADGPCALTATEIAAGAAAFRAAGWRVILYTSFMHVGEARSWKNGSINREHPDWAQRNGSGVAWQYEGPNSPLSPCSEEVLAYTTHYASAQAAAMHEPDATMLDNNELGPLAWGCRASGCGYEPPCAAAFDTYVRSRFNASTLRSCFGVNASTSPVVPPPRAELGTPLYGLWVHWRSLAMHALNKRFRKQLGSGGRLLANTGIDWPDFSLAQDLQYAAEDVVLSECTVTDPVLLHAKLSLGVGVAQGRPFWAALYQNRMRAVELDPRTVRRLLTHTVAHQVVPWLVFESVLLNRSDARAAALRSTAGWLAREASVLKGGALQAPVACMASAATRNSVRHNQSAGVAITPTHCLALATELGVPVRVVYDYDYRETWLEGVSLLVLDGVRCLPQKAQRRIVAWAQTTGKKMLASEDSGQCDGLGRSLPSQLTLFARMNISGHAALTRTDIRSSAARALVGSHAWLLPVSLAGDHHRWIVLPYVHPTHVTVFILCGELHGCAHKYNAAPNNMTLRIMLNASQHACSARLTAVDSAQPLAFGSNARTGQVMVSVGNPTDDIAIVVTLSEPVTASMALKGDDENLMQQPLRRSLPPSAGAAAAQCDSRRERDVAIKTIPGNNIDTLDLQTADLCERSCCANALCSGWSQGGKRCGGSGRGGGQSLRAAWGVALAYGGPHCQPIRWAVRRQEGYALLPTGLSLDLTTPPNPVTVQPHQAGASPPRGGGPRAAPAAAASSSRARPPRSRTTLSTSSTSRRAASASTALFRPAPRAPPRPARPARPARRRSRSRSCGRC